MDAVELLRVEAETIWGRDSRGIAGGTVSVTAMTYDGRTELIDGHADVRPDTPTTVTVDRCWTLTAAPRLPQAPRGFSLVHQAGAQQRPTGWEDDEWRKLMSGNHGPWAALVHGDRIVSVAHCARLTERAAEVGVETEESYRGRGLAPVVVRAWATLLAPTGKVMFYSALEENRASHRVAAQCDAEPLGMLCRLGISS